jgi:hypothetical protein
MSKRPLKATGFARFFFVMLIIAPLAYVAATYYNGEDGIQKLKDLIGIGNKPVSEQVDNQNKPGNQEEQSIQTESLQSLLDDNKKLRSDLEYQMRRNEELLRENEELKRKIFSLEERKTGNSL